MRESYRRKEKCVNVLVEQLQGLLLCFCHHRQRISRCCPVHWSPNLHNRQVLLQCSSPALGWMKCHMWQLIRLKRIRYELSPPLTCIIKPCLQLYATFFTDSDSCLGGGLLFFNGSSLEGYISFQVCYTVVQDLLVIWWMCVIGRRQAMVHMV